MAWALIPLEALTFGQPELKVPHKTPVLSLHLIKRLALAMQNLRVKTEPSRPAETAAAKAEGAIMPLSDLWALACPCNQMSEPLIHTGHWGYNDMRVLSTLKAKEQTPCQPDQCMEPQSDYLKGERVENDRSLLFLHSREPVGVGGNLFMPLVLLFLWQKVIWQERSNLCSPAWHDDLYFCWPSVRRDLDGVCCGPSCLCTSNLTSVWLDFEIGWVVKNSIKMLNLRSN